MRLQGMVYDEIGAEMGCSKQCVGQYLNAALRKAGKERAADKAIIRDYMSTQSKLNKKRNFLNNLVAEEELTRAKIQSLEQIPLKYEEIYPEKLKMDPSGSRREGSRTK